MAYKTATVTIVTAPITKEHHKKLKQLVIDLRYKNQTKLIQDILENSIDGIFNSIYGKPAQKEQKEDSVLEGALEGMSLVQEPTTKVEELWRKP